MDENKMFFIVLLAIVGGIFTIATIGMIQNTPLIVVKQYSPASSASTTGTDTQPNCTPGSKVFDSPVPNSAGINNAGINSNHGC